MTEESLIVLDDRVNSDPTKENITNALNAVALRYRRALIPYYLYNKYTTKYESLLKDKDTGNE